MIEGEGLEMKKEEKELYHQTDTDRRRMRRTALCRPDGRTGKIQTSLKNSVRPDMIKNSGRSRTGTGLDRILLSKKLLLHKYFNITQTFIKFLDI